MRIAIITSGILPVPAVLGGAVENLIDNYLEYNSIHKIHDITIYSVYNKRIKSIKKTSSDVNHYIYIHTESYFYRISRKLYSLFHHDEVYNYYIEYFFEQSYKLMSEHEYDLIILENRPGFSLKLSQRTNIPLVSHIHFDVLSSPNWDSISKCLNGIICVSNYLHNKATKDIQNKCITVHNGINLSLFKKINKADRLLTRKSLNISDNDIVVVYCGRIDPIKGVKELIEAIIMLKENRLKLLIIGGSNYGDQNIENEYIIAVKKLLRSINDQTIFTGYQPYSEIPRLLSAADIAVIPSLCDDAFPTTVLEAMATGLPIIASNRGGIPEQVDERNAILINTDENMVKNLALSINTLIKDKSLRTKMGEASQQKSHQYGKELYAENFFKAINALIKYNGK